MPNHVIKRLIDNSPPLIIFFPVICFGIIAGNLLPFIQPCILWALFLIVFSAFCFVKIWMDTPCKCNVYGLSPLNKIYLIFYNKYGGLPAQSNNESLLKTSLYGDFHINTRDGTVITATNESSLKTRCYGDFHIKLFTNRYTISLLFFFFGFYAIQSLIFPSFPQNHISRYVDQGKYEIQGMVSSLPRKFHRKTRFNFQVYKLKGKDGALYSVKGGIQVSVYSPVSKFMYGDRLKFISEIKGLRNFSNPGGFDYVRYMNLKKMWGSCNVNGYNVKYMLDSRDSDNFRDILDSRATSFQVLAVCWINGFRERFEKLIFTTLNDPDAAAVLSALVTGKRAKISDSLKEGFSRSGASHILAISGTHLSIISVISFFVFNKFLSLFRPMLIRGWSMKGAAFLTLFPLMSYAFLSGFSPSTRRAVIMIVIFMTAYVIDRESDGFNSLAAAGLVILLFDPAAVFSVSFQLSFLAVFFILMGIKLIQKYQIHVKKNLFTRLTGFLFISICAITGTQPIVMHYFYIFTFCGILTNLIVIPFIGFGALPLGIFAFFLEPFFPDISILLIKTGGFILTPCIFTVMYISKMPYSWVECFKPDIFEISFYYIVFCVIFCLVYQFKKKHIKPALIAIGSLLAVLLIHEAMLVKSRFFNKKICCTALDVGQGSSTLIEMPRGVNFLVDGGGFSYFGNFDTGEHIVAPVLRKKRIYTLDFIILTHPEADHINGLVYILNHFKVKRIIKNCDARDTFAYMDFMNAAMENGAKIDLVSKINKNINSDGWEIQFFHPLQPCSSDNLDHTKGYNNNSVVFRLEFNRFSILFAGDIMADAESKLAESVGNALCSNVLIVPHHGSSTSSTTAFLDLVRPETALISCGWRNRFRFPHKEVTESLNKRGVDIYRTDLNGAITVCSGGSGYEVSTWRGD